MPPQSPTLLPSPSAFSSPDNPLDSPPSRSLSPSSTPWSRSNNNGNNNDNSTPRRSVSHRLSRPLPHPSERGPPRRHSSISLLRSASHRPHHYLSKTLHAANKLVTRLARLFLALTPAQRVLVVILGLALAAAGAAALVYSHHIFALLRPVAEGWRGMTGGWVIVFLMVVGTAFPPVVGYSTAVTISGFLYGFPHGWPVAAIANVVGSVLSLVLCRTVFSSWTQRVVGEDKRFVALGQVLRRDGVGVLAMIRFCPLPYSLSNGFLAQVKSVSIWNFGLATALASPKLFVHVFIGSRLALLADEGDAMTARDKAVNYVGLVVGAAVGVTVGWMVYRKTMRRARELAVEEGGVERAAGVGLLGDGDGDEDGFQDGGDRHLEEGRGGRDGGRKNDGAPALMVDEDDIRLWDADGGEEMDDYHAWGNPDGGDTGTGVRKSVSGGYRDEFTEVEMMNAGRP